MKSKTLYLSCAFPNPNINISPKTVSEILDMSLGYVIKHLATIPSTAGCLYVDTLYKILDAGYAQTHSLNSVNFSECNTLVVDDLVHISGEFSTLSKYHDILLKHKNIKIVPISFGIFHGYELTARDKLILKMMSERAEIGCRNELVADILNKSGIKNIRVIGCPSLFYHMDRNFSIANKKDLQKINFSCLVWPVKFKKATKNYLDYVLKTSQKYETIFTLQENPISELFDYIPFDNTYIVRILEEKNDFLQYLLNCGKYFYNLSDWIHGLIECDFTFSRKIHGSVASILAGVPAFCIAVDKVRMGGICEYHKIPFIHYTEFDDSKPIEYYYELADYTEFNKSYAATYDNFIDYCRKNDVDLKINKKQSED